MATSSSFSSTVVKVPYVRIDNLPNQTTEAQIREMFAQCGKVHPKWIDGVFYVHPETGIILASKDKQGVAYVSFRNAATAALAATLCQHYKMHGRRLELTQPDVPDTRDIGTAYPPPLLLPPATAMSSLTSDRVASFITARTAAPAAPVSSSASASASALAPPPRSATIAVRLGPLRPATTAAEVQSLLADRGIDPLVGHIVIAHPPHTERTAYIFYEQADNEVAGQAVKRCHDDIVNGEPLTVKRLTIKEAADELTAVNCGGSLFANITSIRPLAEAEAAAPASLKPEPTSAPVIAVAVSSASTAAAASASPSPAAVVADNTKATTTKKRVHFSATTTTDTKKKKKCECGECDDCAFGRLGFDDPIDLELNVVVDPPVRVSKRRKQMRFLTTKLSLSVVPPPSSSSSSSSSISAPPRGRCKWSSCTVGAACAVCGGCVEHHPIGACRATLPTASASASASASATSATQSEFDFPDD